MTAEVVSLYGRNVRDPAATLRAIADGIDSGAWGPVGCLAVVVLSDTLEVFGAGPDSDGPAMAAVLHAGFMGLVGAIEQHGGDNHETALDKSARMVPVHGCEAQICAPRHPQPRRIPRSGGVSRLKAPHLMPNDPQKRPPKATQLAYLRTILLELRYLNQILRKGLRHMGQNLDKLTASVADIETVADSAVALIGGLAEQIRNATDPAEMRALADRLDAQKVELAAAITANTPAEPEPTDPA